jgi:hypothetical protein
MKYIKLFEDINQDEPQIGDYVIAELKHNEYPALIRSFINNNIGMYIHNDRSDVLPILVKYVNIPENVDDDEYCFNDYNKNTQTGTWYFNKEQLKYWSKNKEDLEIMISQMKYNL